MFAREMQTMNSHRKRIALLCCSACCLGGCQARLAVKVVGKQSSEAEYKVVGLLVVC